MNSTDAAPAAGQEQVLATDRIAAVQSAHTESRKGAQPFLSLAFTLLCGVVGKGDVVVRDGAVACSAGVTTLGRVASSTRSGIGADNSRPRSETCRMTWWTRCDAVCDIRRTPHARQALVACSRRPAPGSLAVPAMRPPRRPMRRDAAPQEGVEVSLDEVQQSRT